MKSRYAENKMTGLSTMTFVALMAAVMCVVAPLSVPLPITAVPISFTNMVIYFAVYLLGMRAGTLSYVVYLLLGFVGLPVFSGFTGGVSKLAGPTGGYLLGFIFLALICGVFADRFHGNIRLYVVGMTLGLAVAYAFGTAWLAYQGNLDFGAALFAGVIPFLPGDAMKIIVVALICRPAKRLVVKAVPSLDRRAAQRSSVASEGARADVADARGGSRPEVREMIESATRKVMDGGTLSRTEAERLMELPDGDVPALVDAVFPIRKKHRGMKVGIQLLTNVRSGDCTQNCAYCAQARGSGAAIDKYPLVSREKLESDARIARERGLSRHCIGLSGIRFSDEEIEELASRVESMKAGSDVPVCCSIGFLTEAQARRLKAAGVSRINHNLNTSRSNYANICTTHTYDERIVNIRMLQGVGFEICCGGIIGMGEGDGGVVDMLFDIREIGPQSVPINFLLPIDGTGLSSADTTRLTPGYCLKTLCLARLLLPGSDIRCAAGREEYLAGRERDLFKVVDSIFASGYLTADGQPVSDAIELVASCGFEYALS